MRGRAVRFETGARRAVDFFACGRFWVDFLAVVLARAEGFLRAFDADALLRDADLRAPAPVDLRAVVLRPRDAGDFARALVAGFFFAALADFFALEPRFAVALEERFFLTAIIPPFLDWYAHSNPFRAAVELAPSNTNALFIRGSRNGRAFP